jgi:putative ABC transport system permease protein
MTPLTPGRQSFMMQRPGDQQWREIDVNAVSPEYFSLVDIPLVRGRTFLPGEMADPPRAAIVTERTARLLWPDRDPIGQTFTLAWSRNQDGQAPVEVVGVAQDAYISSLDTLDDNYAYLPAGPARQTDLQLLVRSRNGFTATAAGLRDAIRELDPGMAATIQPLEANLDFWQSLARLAASVAGALGGLALVLASIGVYGVVSYAVSRRLREVGIRMVLGATSRDVRSLVLRQALRPVAIGALIGAGAAAGVSRVLESVLFGVSALDAAAFVAAAAFLFAVATLASWLPARRAMSVDPMVTLRYE